MAKDTNKNGATPAPEATPPAVERWAMKQIEQKAKDAGIDGVTMLKVRTAINIHSLFAVNAALSPDDPNQPVTLVPIPYTDYPPQKFVRSDVVLKWFDELSKPSARKFSPRKHDRGTKYAIFLSDEQLAALTPHLPEGTTLEKAFKPKAKADAAVPMTEDNGDQSRNDAPAIDQLFTETANANAPVTA